MKVAGFIVLAGAFGLQSLVAAVADFTCSDPFVVRDDAAGVYRLYRTRAGRLLMLWSSAFKGCLQAVSRSASDRLEGPWTHHEVIRYEDSGHGMVFRTFDGRLALALHSPNKPHDGKRLRVFELEDTGDSLRVGRQIGGIFTKGGQ